MEIRAIYDFCPELKTFITFDAKLDNGKTIPCVGHEWHCCDPECDCYLVNIMIDEANSGERLTQKHMVGITMLIIRKKGFMKKILEVLSMVT